MPSTPPAAAAKRGHPSGPRASGSTGGAGRKRKRSSDRDSAAAAPGAQQRIDGVPPSLTPVLLHAIKSRRKYLSKLGVGQNQPSPTTEAAAAPTAATGTGDVLARVAARSEQEQKRHRAAEDANSPLERLASEDATAAFLNGVRREASSSGRGGRSENGWTIEQHGEGTTESVPVACLSFLLGLFSADDGSVKLATRRAALALASELLQRSAECRESFAAAEPLRQFLEVVSNMATSNHNADNDSDTALKLLVQQEAARLLSEISDRFGTHYPRLTVAARFLEEREGIVLPRSSSSAGTNASGLADLVSNNAMAELRRGRDLAMTKIGKAHGRIRKILSRADECFEILVPRIGGSAPAKGPDQGEVALTSKGLGDDGDEDDEEDDDDIDWEEGDDDDEAVGASKAHLPEDHEKAVERTLAQMGRSRGIVDGGIEISLGRGGETEATGGGIDGGASAATAAAAREMLGRCVQLLSETHLPRLSFWAECLGKADMMVQQLAQQDGSTTQTPQTSLVAMTSSLRKKRAETLSLVLALKCDSAKTIASATRLGIGNAASVSSETVSGSTEGGGSATASTAVDASKVNNTNPTGVGVAAASSIGAKLSWKQDLGIKATKKPRKKIRIKFASASSRSRSALEIKARKGL